MIRHEPDPALPLRPSGWSSIVGLVCGFGDRDFTPPPETLLLERQVHGTRVVEAGAHVPLDGSAWSEGCLLVPEEADALVASSAGVVVGVRTADCVPLLMVAPGHRWAAAVHAGWRGTIDGIALEAVRAAGRAGVKPEELLAALGPSIGPCCYEVSFELGERFASAGFDVLEADGDRPRPHLDLRAANRLLLERSGLAPGAVQEVGPCTRCARDRFHSFRADPDSPGRQVSWIGWEARTPFPGREPRR